VPLNFLIQNPLTVADEKMQIYNARKRNKFHIALANTHLGGPTTMDHHSLDTMYSFELPCSSISIYKQSQRTCQRQFPSGMPSMSREHGNIRRQRQGQMLYPTNIGNIQGTLDKERNNT